MKKMFQWISLLLIAASLTSCSPDNKTGETKGTSDEPGPQKQAINTDKAPAAIGPYSQAIQTGNLIFTSGQIPIDPETGEVVSGGIKEQAMQVFENLNAVLNASGADLADVIKTTVYIKDMNDFPTVNSVYDLWIPEPYPARSCVEVSRLPKDVLIEVEAVAVKR